MRDGQWGVHPKGVAMKPPLRWLDFQFQIPSIDCMLHLSSKQLRQAATLKERIQSLEKKLGRILGSPTGQVAPAVPSRRRKMSAAGRARIVAAQKARWAKAKGTKSGPKPVKQARRKMSATSRTKIAAAAKARWAKAKAQGKNSL
jgi:hypothetical protein